MQMRQPLRPTDLYVQKSGDQWCEVGNRFLEGFNHTPSILIPVFLKRIEIGLQNLTERRPSLLDL